MTIHLQTDTNGPRLRYAADFLLRQILGFGLVIDSAPGGSDVLHIRYGKAPVEGRGFFIPAHPFMGRKDKYLPSIEIIDHRGLPAFFDCADSVKDDSVHDALSGAMDLPLGLGRGREIKEYNEHSLKDNAVPVADDRLPFDLFAMTFFLLSRMEEYDATVQRDQHQRFPASAALAFRAGFLEQPLIDQWAWVLYSLLQKQYPQCPPRKPSYQFIPTIDVDFAWAYLHKGWKRTAGMFLKHLLTGKWGFCVKQMKVKAGWLRDPYDTYDDLNQIHQRYDVKALFFMLLGTYGAYDKNNSPQHPAMQKLIRYLSGLAGVGIHPSYASNNVATILRKEIKILEKILNKPVSISRQHFLKLTFPETYRRLLGEGIQEDYSMGYADAVGFRASTAYPFYWYDLEEEKTTTLRIVPFSVMDVTLKNYIGLSPDEALSLCQKIIGQCRNSGGTFCLLWHNSSFSSEMGWEDWGGIYEKIVALGSGE